MRTLLLGFVLWSCDSKDADSVSASDDSSPGGDDSDSGTNDDSVVDDDSGVTSDFDGDGVDAPKDCDDKDKSIHPGADETVADGIDQDCDGGDLCYADADADGFGGGVTVASADLDCGDKGEAAAGGDCDDVNAKVNPGAAEIPADDIDGNCDASEDCYVDADGDGHGTKKIVSSVDVDCEDLGESSTSNDCDDADPKVVCEEFHVGNDVEFLDSSNHGADYLLGTLLVVPTDMTVTAMGVIGKAATGNVRMALYTDSSGEPDALVMETASTPVPVGVLEMPLAKSVALPAGNYWIMGVFDVSASIGIAFPKGEVVQYRSLSFADPMPGTFGTPSTYMGQVFNYYIVGY